MSSIAEQINESTELAAVDIRATEPVVMDSAGPVLATPATLLVGAAAGGAFTVTAWGTAVAVATADG